MIIKLIVKAHGITEARDACLKEGVVPRGEMMPGSGNTVIVITHSYALDQVCNWYHRPRQFLPEIGYEPGTLLAYHVEQI